MQDKLIEKSTKTRHCPKCNGSDVILTYRYWNNDLNCRCRTCDYEWSEKPSDAVRAHDAGTTPTAAVNYAAIDRGWRMFCQSCGTDAPCPNCEVCGALLTMVQCNDTEAGTDEGLTDARWNAFAGNI